MGIEEQVKELIERRATEELIRQIVL